MDVKRYLNTRIWADTWFENLAVDEKLVWIYLLTNQQTNLIGIYEIGLRRISNETGVEINRLQTVMERFANDYKAFHNGYFVVIPNALSHQTLANPNMEKSAMNIFDSLPDEIKKLLQSLGIADFKALMKGLPNRLQTVCKPFINRSVIESESEIEKESEKEGVKGKPFRPDGLWSDDENLEEEIFTSFRAMKEEPALFQTAATNELETEFAESVELEPWPTFDDFWDEYDKKRGDKEKLRRKWKKIPQREKEKIMSYLPLYKESQPDKSFRKDPETFLNNKSWNDEIIRKSKPEDRIQLTGTAATIARLSSRLDQSNR